MPRKRGAMSWSDWTLAEARRQQQQEFEFFTGHRQVDPAKKRDKEAAREARRQRRRRARQPGVHVP